MSERRIDKKIETLAMVADCLLGNKDCPDDTVARIVKKGKDKSVLIVIEDVTYKISVTEPINTDDFDTIAEVTKD